MKKFLAISFLLHLAAALLFFVKWDSSPDLEWGGGETVTVFVELGVKGNKKDIDKIPPDPPFSKGGTTAEGAFQNPPLKKGGGDFPLGDGERDGTGNSSGSGYDSSDKTSDHILALIRQKIERAKLYPAAAKKQGIEGIVTVQFLVAGGTVSSVSVTGSSGSSVLDSEAVATIKRAQPFPPYDGTLTLGLKFDLEE